MRILQIIQKRQLRGAEIFACQLSIELKNAGHHVDVLFLFDGNETALDFPLTFIALGANKKFRFVDFPAYFRLSKIIRRGEYDVIQANASDTLKYAVMSRVLFGWKAKLVFRNANKMGSFVRSALQKGYNRWLLSKVDQFISVSENCRVDLIGIFPSATSRSTTIPIGTYNYDHVPAIPKPLVTAQPIILSIGAFVPEKNHEFLLDIFHQFLKDNSEAELWLVGEGRLNAALQKKAGVLGVKNRVRFWGYRKDAISILKAAHVLVMPSLTEGIPGAILEAISCDVPVVASAVGGIPEIIEDEVTGICIAGLQSREYVEKIAYLLAHPDYNKRLRLAAKRKLVDEYMMDEIARKFIGQYERLTATKDCITIKTDL